MTDKEKLEALLAGKKLRDSCWPPAEYVHLQEGALVDECGDYVGLEILDFCDEIYGTKPIEVPASEAMLEFDKLPTAKWEVLMGGTWVRWEGAVLYRSCKYRYWPA